MGYRRVVFSFPKNETQKSSLTYVVEEEKIMRAPITFLFIMIASLAFGQELSINDRGVLPFYSLGDTEVRLPLRVRNHDTTDHRLMVELETEMADGHIFFFCWDLCYPEGHTSSLGSLNIPAGDSLGAFTLYFRPNNTKGVSEVKVTFFDQNDPDVRVSHTFSIRRFGTTSIAPADQVSFLPPSPNPATSFTELHFELAPQFKKADLRLYSLLGRELKRVPVEPGATDIRFDLQDLRPGVYFLYLHADGKPLRSHKLVVSR